VAAPGDLKQRFCDPLLREVELSHSATYYPAGFPVTVSSNSLDVQEAARESWGDDLPAFDRAPLELRIVVRKDGPLAPEPSFRSQGHLLSIVSCPDNFAVLDLRALFAYAFVSARTAADHAWFRWFFLDPMALILLTQRHVAPVHAAYVVCSGSGILLCGPSGAGKSTLAYACARAGWTYVSDDCTWLLPEVEHPHAIGAPHRVRLRHDAPALFPELAGSIARARPNGKIAIEVRTAELPGILTAPRSAVNALVFLRRAVNATPRLETLPSSALWEELVRDGAYASYGEETDRRLERERRKLLRVPGFRLHYRDWEDALELLSTIVARLKTS